ncbi:DNA-binding NarL/FixJ family response regulator (plasmid) [Ensifer sp. WSM1721]|uniref:response regulator transcription factor n=1 Tax=Ensifer sp. WSM1721 TaxID=1041159 RepID=UPI00047C0218|nr:response regulator transcription factor [Ensifer sp. WSM1721]
MQKPDELARQSVILLMDDLRLRRAAVESLLTPWAEGFGASIELGQMSSFEGAAEPLRNRAMILMNIGNVSIFRAGLDVSLRQFVDRAAGVPVVVMSDCDDPGEMARAFEAGVRGFVPTSIAPELALKALTFILNGGHFFPPSVLQPTSRRARLTLSAHSSDFPNKPSRGSTMPSESNCASRLQAALIRPLRVLARSTGQDRARRPARLPGQRSQLSRKPLRKAARKGSIM